MAMNQVGLGPVFSRSEMGYPFNYHYPNTDMEKRQLFLRSYQFSRKKKSVGERIKGSFFRVKRVIWVRLRSARKIRKMVWSRLKLALLGCARRKRFLRLHSQNSIRNTNSSWSSSCFW
ncbi:hypothetical protein Vadar_005041 [Vaccinium darrowii]|uniref:Uncharacterized protein n=1 Tax=Vaccinium darrowii TaxID=229202 RepID=A0ACB7WY08_9ERIC|nr:hypothetical protein Vadar_005041 [Vaccinium darrowii]